MVTSICTTIGLRRRRSVQQLNFYWAFIDAEIWCCKKYCFLVITLLSKLIEELKEDFRKFYELAASNLDTTIMTKTKVIISFLFVALSMTSCDPVHTLHLDNKTGKAITVIYKPLIDIAPVGSEIETITINKIEFAKVTLASGQQMKIGQVIARYTPNQTDISLDYLETISGSDTIKLVGKKAIFNFIEKVQKLDWRLIIK